MKKLTDLNPKFIGVLRPNSGEAIEFDCPACLLRTPEVSKHYGPHRLVACLAAPIDGKERASYLGTTRADGHVHQIWEREGSDFESLTLTPSIVYPCWHGWIEDGMVFDLAEATRTIVQVVVDNNGVVVGRAGELVLSPRQAKMLDAGRLALALSLHILPPKGEGR